MKKTKHQKSQSIFEYICVTMVFAGVGIAGFILANQAAVSNLRGQVSTYREPTTEMGRTLEDGVSNEQYNWPNTWNDPQENTPGAIPNDYVNKPDAHTLPIPVANTNADGGN